MHKLLQRQLRQAQRASSDGSLDLEALLSLVGAGYDEIDRERRFTAHAHKVLRDEYAALTERQLKVEAEKSEAERARAAAEAELLQQERLSLLGRLTSSLAHELRNPLSTIRNTIHAIGEAATQNGLDIARQMSRVHRTIDRCDGIIGDLLDYARSRDLVPASIRLDSWLADVLNAQRVPERIAIERHFGAAGAVIAIDPDRLRCAIVKVFENALEALVETPDLIRPRITVSTAIGDRIEIAITDTGPGVPADVLPHIFEPLFSTRSFGTGLGLATAKQIVENHKGDIAIARGPEGGARVIIRLPMAAMKGTVAA
ncbi:MAG TPA: ATP-binding protein [Stellaceae bacterium]|jgi:signal transduction histidine kinase|nr:ATP-binding protein [Stellaceae bacterium]